MSGNRLHVGLVDSILATHRHGARLTVPRLILRTNDLGGHKPYAVYQALQEYASDKKLSDAAILGRALVHYLASEHYMYRVTRAEIQEAEYERSQRTLPETPDSSAGEWMA